MNECIKYECIYVLLSAKALSLFPLDFVQIIDFQYTARLCVCVGISCLSVLTSESLLEAVEVLC